MIQYMNWAYQIHIERIQQHEEQHNNTSCAYEVIQTLDPDLSCWLCFPDQNHHRSYRGFWSWYKREYNAYSYSNQTTTAHFLLTNNPTYSEARETTRNIVFSCRYRTPLNNPRNIIENLFTRYTRYTLQSYFRSIFKLPLLIPI